MRRQVKEFLRIPAVSAMHSAMGPPPPDRFALRLPPAQRRQTGSTSTRNQGPQAPMHQGIPIGDAGEVRGMGM